MYFLRIFRMDIADENALFKELLPPTEVGGEFVFTDELLDPLHRILGHPVVRNP